MSAAHLVALARLIAVDLQEALVGLARSFEQLAADRLHVRNGRQTLVSERGQNIDRGAGLLEVCLRAYSFAFLAFAQRLFRSRVFLGFLFAFFGDVALLSLL